MACNFSIFAAKKKEMNIALLTAGGTGNRMGQSIPKQFMPIDNKPVIIYTLESFQCHPEINAIAVVCLEGWEIVLQSYANQYNISKLKWIFKGGESNQESIYNGLIGLKDSGCSDDDIVLIQTGLICKEAIMEQVDDTVREISIPRERLVQTQTPHTYHLGTLIKGHHEAKEKGLFNTVASCTLFSALGIKEQHLVKGSEQNGLKLTNPGDIELFKALLHSSKECWIK